MHNILGAIQQTWYIQIWIRKSGFVSWTSFGWDALVEVCALRSGHSLVWNVWVLLCRGRKILLKTNFSQDSSGHVIQRRRSQPRHSWCHPSGTPHMDVDTAVFHTSRHPTSTTVASLHLATHSASGECVHPVGRLDNAVAMTTPAINVHRAAPAQPAGTSINR